MSVWSCFKFQGALATGSFLPQRYSALIRGISPPADTQWIAFGVCFWGAASLLQCAAFNLAGLAVCRVFIGVGEGLFGTGILYYLSLWYKRGEMGVRVFWFLGPTALAG